MEGLISQPVDYCGGHTGQLIAMQRQTAVTAHLTLKQLLLFAFAEYSFHSLCGARNGERRKERLVKDDVTIV